MHPAMMGRWGHHRRHHGCGGPEFGAEHHPGHHRGGLGPGGFGPGGGFGVRRPLRFLAYRLELDESQVDAFAGILDDIKTERAQFAVDERRALKAFAEAVGGDTYDREKAEAAAQARKDANARIEATLVDALGRIHALLDEGQRSHLAALIRSGHLTL